MAKHDVTFQRPEYKAAGYGWTLVDDVVAGSEKVKAKGKTYLPQPNPSDLSAENEERYRQYKARAVFYNATSRTVQSLVGAAFRKVPALTCPDALKYVEDDVDGKGISIYQQSQSAVRQVLKKGRQAILVDYPQVTGPVSRADMDSGRVRATIASFNAEQVINWRTDKIGATHKLVLVVIYEQAEEVTADGFGVDLIPQYRVLRLQEGVYTQEIWRQAEKGWDLHIPPFVIRNGSGGAWTEIPFTFIGSNDNDASVDPSPLYDMAEVNIAHYRNSADYEEGVYMHGQGTMVLSVGEMAVDQFASANPNGVMLGARGGIVLGNNGRADLLQMDANSAAKEAMDQKEEQMRALGARLLQSGSAVKTATEAQGDMEQDHSVLSLVVSNVSEAYTLALQWMAEFMATSGDCVYQINQEFTRMNLDAPLLTALVGFWQTGEWPRSDMLRVMRNFGLIDSEKSDEDVADELETNPPSLELDAAE